MTDLIIDEQEIYDLMNDAESRAKEFEYDYAVYLDILKRLIEKGFVSGNVNENLKKFYETATKLQYETVNSISPICKTISEYIDELYSTES